MPNTIKYSTTGDTFSLKKGNFFIGVGDVGKGPSTSTQTYNGVSPVASGYTIYIYNPAQASNVSFYSANNDAELITFTNGISSSQTNYISNGGNFANGTISPFNTNYSDPGGLGQVVSITNNLPYVGSSSTNAMYLNYNGGRVMSTVGLLTTGVTYTFSFWAKIISGSSFSVSWNNQNGSGDTNAWTSSANLTTSWQRYSQTFTYNTSKNNFYFYSRSADTTRAAIFTEFQVTTGSTYGGPGLQNANECLRWYATQTNYVCVNRDYEGIVTNGLSFNIDAGFTPSYPRTGSTLYDISYGGNNGTLINGPIYSGSNEGVLVFDGADDYVDFGSNGSSLIQNKTAFTISTLFKLDQLDVLRPIFGTLAYGCGGNLGIVSSNGGLTFYNDYGPWPAAGGTCYSVGFSPYVVVGQWIYAVATYDGTTTRMYGIKNGTLSTTSGGAKTGVTNTFARNLRLFQGGSYVSKGSVISANIYNRVLSQSEILQNYQSYIPRLVNGNVITNGLTYYVDAGYNGSYPTTGTTWYDISGNGYIGTLTNGPTFNSANGGSIVFDGIDDTISTIGTTSTFSFIQNTGVFTISAWVKLTDLSVARYFMGNNDGTTGSKGFYLGYQGNTGRLWLAITYGVGGQLTLSQSKVDFFTLNEWVLVTCVGNGVNCQFYKNGIPFDTPSNFGTFSTGNSARDLNIGRINSFNSSYWKGDIALTQIYNRPLSSDEVLQNFNAQKSRFGL